MRGAIDYRWVFAMGCKHQLLLTNHTGVEIFLERGFIGAVFQKDRFSMKGRGGLCWGYLGFLIFLGTDFWFLSKGRVIQPGYGVYFGGEKKTWAFTFWKSILRVKKRVSAPRF